MDRDGDEVDGRDAGDEDLKAEEDEVGCDNNSDSRNSGDDSDDTSDDDNEDSDDGEAPRMMRMTTGSSPTNVKS